MLETVGKLEYILNPSFTKLPDSFAQTTLSQPNYANSGFLHHVLEFNKFTYWSILNCFILTFVLDKKKRQEKTNESQFFLGALVN